MPNTKEIAISSEYEVQLKTATSSIVAQANAMIVGDDETYAEATEFLARLKKHVKAIKDDKESIYRPAKEVVDQIQGRYKPILDEAAEAERIVKAKALDFVREKDRIEQARIAEERRKAEEHALAEAQKFMDEYGGHAQAAADAAIQRAEKLRAEGNDLLADRFEKIAREQMAKLDAEAKKKADDALKAQIKKKAEKVDLTSKSETGKSVVSKVWDFELVDISQVPAEFLQLDNAKVRAAIRDGRHEIPGLNVYQKEQLSVRSL